MTISPEKMNLSEIAKEYLRKKPVFYVFIRPQEALFYRRYQPFAAPVLDFGCGDGFFAQIAFSASARIDVGFDVDSQALEKARRSGIYHKLVLPSGGKIPFPDNYFPTIVSNSVLEHIRDLPHWLKEIHRVLGEGGKFYLTVMTDKWEKYLLGGRLAGNLYRRTLRRIQRHHHLLSAQEWSRVLEKDFRIIRREGYLDRRESRFLEIFHYLSVPLWGMRHLFPQWPVSAESWLTSKLLRRGGNPLSVPPESGAALFFELEKEGEE